MNICIVSGDGSCPPDNGGDWSLAVVLIVLILAIAAYKSFKAWLRRRYPLPDDDVPDC